MTLVITWLPVLGGLLMLLLALYLLAGTLLEPEPPYEHGSLWDDDDWSSQAERGGW